MGFLCDLSPNKKHYKCRFCAQLVLEREREREREREKERERERERESNNYE